MRQGIPQPVLRFRRSILKPPTSVASSLSSTFFYPSRTLANVRPDNDLFLTTAFAPSPPHRYGTEFGLRPDRPPDERTLKLGKTLRTLQSRLPNLLATPLPQEILSPHISLHLFPSTHPHLPTVSGRVAYHAALWTSPITWGRVPLVGNVNLEILSERMVKNGGSSPSTYSTKKSSYGSEKLIVRWKTCGKTKGLGVGARYQGIGARQRVDKITEWLGGDVRDDEEFCGLFIFEFDEEGRVSSHVIERADGREGWDNSVGRVVALTDWLLGRFNGKEKPVEGLALGYCTTDGRRGATRRSRSD